MTTLLAKYLKEREDVELVEHVSGHGYATYKKLNDQVYHLIDIFVVKEHRRTHIASELSQVIYEIAKSDNAKFLMGSVCLKANGVTQSLKAVLGDGFEYASINGDMMYFRKEIKE